MAIKCFPGIPHVVMGFRTEVAVLKTYQYGLFGRQKLIVDIINVYFAPIEASIFNTTSVAVAANVLITLAKFEIILLFTFGK